ncbi:unnamed protein product, partial [Vitis vinifera]
MGCLLMIILRRLWINFSNYYPNLRGHLLLLLHHLEHLHLYHLHLYHLHL